MTDREQKTPPEPATPPATPADPLDIQTRPDPVPAAAARMERSVSQTSANETIDIAVYFPDGTDIVLNVENGKNKTVQQLVDLVIAQKGLPAQAKDAFDLWFISAHLALQLKANHIPYRLAMKWPDLLTKFSKTNDDIDIAADEPVLTFMRNVYFAQEQEEKVTNVHMIELLFAEAKSKVVQGLYPFDPPQFIEMGGLLALLDFGAYNPNTHNQHFYDQHIADLLPAHQRKRRLSLKGKNPREQLLEAHKQATSQFENNTQPINIQKDFLRICRDMPFYGCAFFDGQIETPRGMMKLVNQEDKEVRIGINREGIYIIDPIKVSLILGLTYKEFSWQFATSKKCTSDPKHCLPCLFIQFQIDGVNKLLQIFSKQAVMMDALIDAFVGFLLQSPVATDQIDGGAGGDVVDGRKSSVDGRVRVCLQRQESFSQQIKAANRSSSISNKFDKLSLRTVDVSE